MLTRQTGGKLVVAMSALGAIVIIMGTIEAPRQFKADRDIGAVVTLADVDISPAVALVETDAAEEARRMAAALAMEDPAQMAATNVSLTNTDAAIDQALDAVEAALATSDAVLSKTPKTSGLQILKNHRGPRTET